MGIEYGAEIYSIGQLLGTRALCRIRREESKTLFVYEGLIPADPPAACVMGPLIIRIQLVFLEPALNFSPSWLPPMDMNTSS